MYKLLMSALATGLLVLTACGTTAQVTDVEKGVTLSANQPLTQCKGAAFHGNEWYENGEVWGDVAPVEFNKPTQVKRSGENHCLNESGQVVTLTVTDDKSGASESFETSETHFYFVVDSSGKLAGIKKVTPNMLFDVAVTTTTRNELYVKSATLDGKEIAINGSTAFNSVSGLTLPSVLPGVLELLVCFNVTDMSTCNNVVLGGKMDVQNSVYLKVVQKSFVPYKIVSYKEVSKEQYLVAELMSDGSFASPAKITPIIWDGSTVIIEKPIVDDLNIVAGLYGSEARGLNIVHTGATWPDIGDWGQSNFSLWCRMQLGGQCGYSLASVNDSSRGSGSWLEATFPGIFGDSEDDRQIRRTVTLTAGKKYNIKYVLKTGLVTGGTYLDIVSTNNAGDKLQVSIYNLALSANSVYADSFTFECTASGDFYLADHTGKLSSGSLKVDDLSVVEVP